MSFPLFATLNNNIQLTVTPQTVGFHDNAIFPLALSYGSSGGPGWMTDIQVTDSGSERRIPRWGSEGRMQYNISESVKSDDDVMTLYKFARARRGSAFGFRFSDWRDFTQHPDGRTVSNAINDRQNIGAGDGSQTQFQVSKTYVDDYGYQTLRKITRLTSELELDVYRDTVLQSLGVDYTVDIDTGVITFQFPVPAGQAIDVAYQFHVPVRFGEEVDEWLQAVQDDFSSSSFPGLTLVEIPDRGEHSELFHFGGAAEFTVAPAGNVYLIRFANGLFQRLAGHSVNVEAHMFDPANLTEGGPYVVLQNGAGTGNVTVRDFSDTTTVTTITPGNAASLYFVNGFWQALSL